MKLLEFNIEQEYFIGILGNYLPKRNGGIEISEDWLIYKKERKKKQGKNCGPHICMWCR